jgi:outer membrane protein TolC
MNDRELVVGSEVLLLPADDAADQPITYSLYQAVMAGITDRPEIAQAILSIDDSSIRQQVAMNARLPQLDARLQTKFSSLGTNLGDQTNDVFSGKFVDYLVGLVFERPIGNRKAEADMRRAKLQRMQSVIAYRNTVQQITREVKESLDKTTLNYRLISQTRTGRLASAESLRTFLVEKELTKGYTVDRLNTEFTRQESLAQAERAENAALSEYNQAIADLYLAMGRTLERANISFNVDDGDVRSSDR